MFRISRKKDGFVVEQQKTKWYGKKYWAPYITWHGDDKTAYCFHSVNMAVYSFLKKIEAEIRDNTPTC